MRNRANFLFLKFCLGSFLAIGSLSLLAQQEPCETLAQSCKGSLKSRVQLCKQYQSRYQALEAMSRAVTNQKSESGKRSARSGCEKGIRSFQDSLKIYKDAARILATDPSADKKTCGEAMTQIANTFESNLVTITATCSKP